MNPPQDDTEAALVRWLAGALAANSYSFDVSPVSGDFDVELLDPSSFIAAMVKDWAELTQMIQPALDITTRTV